MPKKTIGLTEAQARRIVREDPLMVQLRGLTERLEQLADGWEAQRAPRPRKPPLKVVKGGRDDA